MFQHLIIGCVKRVNTPSVTVAVSSFYQRSIAMDWKDVVTAVDALTKSGRERYTAIDLSRMIHVKE
jgi:hypothetical protein